MESGDSYALKLTQKIFLRQFIELRSSGTVLNLKNFPKYPNFGLKNTTCTLWAHFLQWVAVFLAFLFWIIYDQTNGIRR